MLRQVLPDARKSATKWQEFLECFVDDEEIVARVKTIPRGDNRAVTSNSIQNLRRALPEVIFPIQRQTPFESKAETHSASNFLNPCLVSG